jgi:hypothetical protein
LQPLLPDTRNRKGWRSSSRHKPIVVSVTSASGSICHHSQSLHNPQSDSAILAPPKVWDMPRDYKVLLIIILDFMWARAVPNSQIGQIHFRSVPLRGPFCKGIQSRKMLYVRHKSEKTSCTLVGLQAAASLKLRLTHFGSFILKLMRYAIQLVRRGQTVVITHVVMRLQRRSIKRGFWRLLLND